MPGEDEQETQSKKNTAQSVIDIRLSQLILTVNIVILISKTVAAVLSGSLSIVSAVIDSVVDLASGTIIWVSLYLIENANPNEYPRGRRRLEPLAIILVAMIMGIANLVMILESISLTVEDKIDPRVDAAAITLMCVTIVVKFTLMLVCHRYRSPSTRLLALDQRNDVITNIVALVCGLIGTHLWKYADPIGAILVW